MAEIFGSAWTSQYGAVGEGAWQIWAKALANIAPEVTAVAVNLLVERPSKFPPNLPEFLALCGQDRERQLSLPGRELAFPHLMNIVCSGDKKAIGQLSPALYWIYKNIDLFAWRRMETREARKVFSDVYDRALKVSDNDLIPPPAQLDSPEEMENRKRKANEAAPEYVSKRKQAANSALENLKRMVGHGA